MVQGGLRVARIRGIDIRIDPSWLVIAALVTWSFWGRFTTLQDRDGGVALVMAVIAAVLFFLSVLLHELAHAFEAQRRGVHVGGITLFLFGGVTQSKFDVKRPVDEFFLTAVGPFTSFLVGGVLAVAATGAGAADLGTVAEVAGLVGWINIALGVFNLIPGAPLDGGRLLRSVVWWRTGDRRRSIIVAATAGRVVGGLLIGLGIAQILFVEGAFVGGLWIAFIGWFLRQAAMAERVQAELADRVADMPTDQLVSGGEPVAADATLDEVVDQWRRGEDREVLPVADDSRELVGALSLDDVRKVPADERRERTVASVMDPVASLPRIDLDPSPDDVLDAMTESDVLVVVDGDRRVGLVTTERLVTAARRAEQVESASRRRRP